MLLILDSNEYIFALGSIRDPRCEELLETIAIRHIVIFIRICRMIVAETRNNLTPEAFKEFMLLVRKVTMVDEDAVVPFETVFKYETIGLKSADAFIAAYTEWTGAEVLVTENRHFLTRQSNLPFKVLPAEKCLKLIKSSLR